MQIVATLLVLVIRLAYEVRASTFWKAQFVPAVDLSLVAPHGAEGFVQMDPRESPLCSAPKQAYGV